ncbi:B-cell receptor CD22 [Antechinus flavipes]|uniref:B-cell receptor CD22 n=1 Tax=Antechinus flavipes TaxID=38775 RepID=UPI0022367BAC|nr:B-cell receptor CD22 [Antechinus flavipes]XP_051844880.1 B-cell receptor CD22 [Antechinus flavipes]
MRGLLQLSFLAIGFPFLGLCNWNVKLPNDIDVWEGTCVQIPCSFKIKNDIQSLEDFLLYHNPVYDEAIKKFQGTILFSLHNSPENSRIVFLGRQKKEDCSLLIREVQMSDSGVLGLRMIAQGDEMWMSYMHLNVTATVPPPHIQIPQQLQELQQVTVTCFLNHFCYDYLVSLRWFLDGQEVPADQVKKSTFNSTQRISTESQFTFTPNWTHHGKELACRVWDKEDKQFSEKIVQLDVRHTPKITIEANIPLEVKEGESVTLKCLLQSSNPEVQGRFLWFRDEIDLLNQSENLILSNIQWQWTGNYQCAAMNEIGQGKSEAVHLQVLYSPKLSKVQSNKFTVLENDTVELYCTTKAYPLPTNYIWYQDEKQILGETNQKLMFQRVNRQQTGQYTCLAENSEGWSEISEKARLDVQYPPTRVFVTIISQMPIREGDFVTLACSYEQSNPPVNSYFWRSQLSKKVRSNIFNISKVSWNAEPITCWACNIQCSPSTPLNLDVQYAPRDVRIILVTPKSAIRSGDHVRLQCDFGSSHPQNVNYSWTLNGKHFHKGKYLNWSSISPEDAGLYICIVTNSIGQSRSQEWDLNVLYPPRHLQVSINPSDMVMEKTSVELTCEADANPAIHLYTWFDWRGQKINYYGQKLTLWPVMTYQSGAYWCQGTNKLGTGQSLPAMLTVYYSPETIGKRIALGFGVCLAIFLLALLVFQYVRCWKKIREQDFRERPSRQGSFFIRNKRMRKPPTTAAPQSLGYYNPAAEERVDYSTLQFPLPSSPYLETSPVSIQSEDQSVTYAVVKKPSKSDYENVTPQSSPEEEGLHYSELIQFGVGGRLTTQEEVEYVTLKH